MFNTCFHVMFPLSSLISWMKTLDGADGVSGTAVCCHTPPSWSRCPVTLSAAEAEDDSQGDSSAPRGFSKDTLTSEATMETFQNQPFALELDPEKQQIAGKSPFGSESTSWKDGDGVEPPHLRFVTSSAAFLVRLGCN